jgi:hypothetical protein
VGSGLLQSHLFDNYRSRLYSRNNCLLNEAAFAFALRVTRSCQPDSITCHSGGFIASGAISHDKQPIVLLPRGLRCYGDEGFGEVQTPLHVPSSIVPPRIGDPIFFRPSKAGEIAERFHQYLLVQGNRIVSRARTYRGDGHTFY